MGNPKKQVFYHSFEYQEQSWQRSRRVVAKVEWHVDELFPRVGFIVTNLNRHGGKFQIYVMSDDGKTCAS